MPERLPRRRPLVLMHHGFTDRPRADDPEGLFVTLSALEAQLDQLLNRGWRALDLDGYLSALSSASRARRAFLLTMDDGFASVTGVAEPLRRRGVPAVLFVPTELVGRTAAWLPHPADEPLLDGGELRQLSASGIEIGVHGLDHRPMTGLDDAELRRQCLEARTCLADLVGRPPRAFAYPYGVFDRNAQRAVEAAGYQIAFSVHDDAGRFAISRVDVNAFDTLLSFRLKTLPPYRRMWRLAGHLGPLRRAVNRAVNQRSSSHPSGACSDAYPERPQRPGKRKAW